MSASAAAVAVACRARLLAGTSIDESVRLTDLHARAIASPDPDMELGAADTGLIGWVGPAPRPLTGADDQRLDTRRHPTAARFPQADIRSAFDMETEVILEQALPKVLPTHTPDVTRRLAA